MDNEKVCVNLPPAELGKIDVLVAQGLYASRTDVIRSGIRSVLEANAPAVERVMRDQTGVGVFVIDRKSLEATKRSGKRIQVSVVGMVVIKNDVSPALADDAIESVRIFGSLRGPKAVLERIAHKVARGMDR